MKPSNAANLSLILVVIGWPLGACGVLMNLGDLPDPRIPPVALENMRHMGLAILFVGILMLLSSLWLSGYAFVFAKRRAILAMAASVVPFAVIFAGNLV